MNSQMHINKERDAKVERLKYNVQCWDFYMMRSKANTQDNKFVNIKPLMIRSCYIPKVNFIK